MGNNIFKAPETTGQQVADALPQGRAWGSKNIEDSNTRGLIDSVAIAHNLTQQQVELLDDEFRIDQTFDLIEEWEESVGLPNDCISIDADIDARRQAVIDRFKKDPIVTLQEFQDAVDAAFPTLGVVLYPGFEFFSFEYDFEIEFTGGADDKFILVAEFTRAVADDSFEYGFEFSFPDNTDESKLRCFIEEFLPANAYLYVIANDPAPVPGENFIFNDGENFIFNDGENFIFEG